jgi:prepilin-type N-terminal cleavage/methylation domain-containing protein
MKLLKDQSGVTLTELLVSILLGGIIFGAAVTTFVTFLNVSTKAEDQQRAQDTARSTVSILAGHIRNAMTTSATGAAINSSSSSFDLVLLVPLPGTTTSATTNPRGLAHVRYCLENRGSKNDTIWFQTSPYNSSTAPNPPSLTSCPSSSWGTKQRAFDHIVNQSMTGRPPLFAYNTDTATPPNIISVEIHPIVDWAPNRDHRETELRTTVNLRNLNRAPTASMACQGLANGHALCDGSSSTDPDGQPLTYAWKMNGTALPTESSYRLDKFPLTSKVTYSFQLTVTDTAGVTSSVTKSVTMP